MSAQHNFAFGNTKVVELGWLGRRDEFFFRYLLHDPIPGAIVAVQSIVGDAQMAVLFTRLGTAAARFGFWTATKEDDVCSERPKSLEHAQE